MEDRHKNRIQDNLSFLVKVCRIKKSLKTDRIEQDTDYDRLRPELLKHKLFPATHLARIEERPNKKLELYLQVPLRLNVQQNDCRHDLEFEITYLQL